MKRLLIASIISYLALAPAAGAEEAFRGRSVTVSGESMEQVAPDQAILSLALISKDNSLDVAKRANDAQVERLMTIARQFTIPKEKIATSNIYIAPQYTYNNKNNEQEFAGYMVSRSLRITMDSLDIHEKLLSALVEAKIEQVNGIEFRLANPDAHAAALRTKAFTDAKTKAEALAQAAGGKLGQALIINASDSTTPIGAPVPMPVMAKAMRSDMAESSVAPSLPGMVELRQSVNVTFALE